MNLAAPSIPKLRTKRKGMQGSGSGFPKKRLTNNFIITYIFILADIFVANLNQLQVCRQMPPKKNIKAKRGNRGAVLTTLRERIVDGEYPQGFKLVEQDLAQEFGVSRPLLREILADLERQGLVEKQPNKGTMVRRVDYKNLLEIMEIREVLEGLAARLAAQNSTPEEWRDLEKEFGEPIEKMVSNQDLDHYLRLLTRLRERMVQAARNEELSKHIHSLYAKIMIVQRRIVILPGRMQEAMDQHRQVIRALIEGDPEKAEAAKRLNLRSARGWLEKYKKWII